METNNTDTSKYSEIRQSAIKWFNEFSSLGKTALCDNNTSILGGIRRWESLTGREIEGLYLGVTGIDALPSPTAAIEGVKEVGGKLSYTVKNTGSLGIDIFEDGNTHPIFFTASNHPKSIANAQRIVMAVNNFYGLVAIAKRAAFLFGNEANYPEGTIGYNIAQDAKNILNNINNLKP